MLVKDHLQHKKTSEALQYIDAALQELRSGAVVNNISEAKYLALAARVYLLSGEIKAAEEAIKEAIAILTSRYGDRHPLVREALTILSLK